MTTQTPKRRLREAAEPRRRLLLSMGSRTRAPIRHARGWIAEERSALMTLLEERAERTRKRRVRDIEKPNMKALGVKVVFPVKRAARLKRERRENHGIKVARERAVHLLGVKRGSPLNRRETSRSERREGRVKVERAKRMPSGREIVPLDRRKRRGPPARVTATCSSRRTRWEGKSKR